jgi:redox-sensing transcriptional repressor
MIRQLNISIIILAVPAEVTEDIFHLCIESGVRAFLNFAPGKLSAPGHVRVHTTDVTLELESLAYYR